MLRIATFALGVIANISICCAQELLGDCSSIGVDEAGALPFKSGVEDWPLRKAPLSEDDFANIMKQRTLSRVDPLGTYTGLNIDVQDLGSWNVSEPNNMNSVVIDFSSDLKNNNTFPVFDKTSDNLFYNNETTTKMLELSNKSQSDVTISRWRNIAMAPPLGGNKPNIDGWGGWNKILDDNGFNDKDTLVVLSFFPDGDKLQGDCNKKDWRQKKKYNEIVYPFVPLSMEPPSQPVIPSASTEDKQVVGAAYAAHVRYWTARGGTDSEALGCNNIKFSESGSLLVDYGKVIKRPKFSTRQFPEVVRLVAHRLLPGDTVEWCSGTIVAPDWIITAAHCITGYTSAELARKDGPAGDVIWDIAADGGSITVTAANSAVSGVNKTREADWAIIHGDYDIYAENVHDIALVHLENGFEKDDFPAATLTSSFVETGTFAGYGVSNTEEPFGTFFVSTGPPFHQVGGMISFVPEKNVGSFCQGDSGGPLFSGVNRGCQPTDWAHEARPRSVEGIISYNILTAGASKAEKCIAAPAMKIQDITTADARQWICRVSRHAVDGCDGNEGQ